MVYISLRKPDAVAVKKFLLELPRGTFNYDHSLSNATEDHDLDAMRLKCKKTGGYVADTLRVHVGSGKSSYDKCVQALKNWEHFQLPWAYVSPRTGVKVGEKLCVCSKPLLAWTLNPLQIRYVKNKYVDGAIKQSASFRFGHGTLDGHFLAGEESFSVDWSNADNKVWYSISTISKPAHPLSVLLYPFVRHLQSRFKYDSVKALKDVISKN